MSLFALYVSSKPSYASQLGYFAQFFIFRQFIQNSDLPCKYANMFTLFGMAVLKIRRQGYLVQEITKPGEICYSCKETRFFVLILELDSPRRNMASLDLTARNPISPPTPPRNRKIDLR